MEVEYCTGCGEPTPYVKSDHIDTRSYYIEGTGQLCVDCHSEIYGESREDKNWIDG